jgi:hypothetical protein
MIERETLVEVILALEARGHLKNAGSPYRAIANLLRDQSEAEVSSACSTHGIDPLKLCASRSSDFFFGVDAVRKYPRPGRFAL